MPFSGDLTNQETYGAVGGPRSVMKSYAKAENMKAKILLLFTLKDNYTTGSL